MQPLKEYLKTTPKYISLLAANGITTLRQFLQYFPRAYEDRKNMVLLHDMVSEEEVYSVKVFVQKKTLIKTPRGKKIIELQVVDTAGAKASVNFFSNGFLLSSLKTDQRYVVVGKPKRDKNKIMFWHPELIPTEAPESIDNSEIKDQNSESNSEEPLTSNQQLETSDKLFNVGRLYPIYPELSGISPVWFAKKMWENIGHIPEFFHEHLPKELLEMYELIDIPTMIRNLHYPDSRELQEKAQHRLFFDKLLQIQLSSLLNKAAYQ